MDFTLDSGNTAWMIVATALVLLMTPALAFFYGGMVRTKSVLNMMMMSFISVATIGVVWFVYGYGLAFGGDTLGGLVGSPSGLVGLNGVGDDMSLAASSGVPTLVMAAFQATFAIITVALISGSVADRMKFGAWTLFTVLWVTLVYTPIAHGVWGGGLLGSFSPSTVIDFAGGTVVHINAGVAGLVLAILLGTRKGFGKEPFKPHNLPFVMLGSALLWFGWFGFNAGSEFAADATAGRAFLNTTIAPAVAVLGWLLVEKIRDGKPTSLGAASGIVAGLVAITPAAANVDTWGALAIGFIAGVVCAMAVGLKYKFGYDDSLDVVGVHLVGGVVGTVLIGFFANLDEGTTWAPDGALNGLFYGGGWTQLGTQIIGALVAIIFSGVMTLIIGLALKYTIGIRVPEEVEVSGIDLAEHGETAYEEAV
ncbi:ammonium transporter [Demequina capsici]|uniref:Ammonium transporter n=1 Tax=Demequina capsici TaxID=3075620 RepID=A0AA96F3T4_9MICO|nr:MULTISPECIES: ammonium transporter [unclassified Demequina]WNM23448.1 ammonium transporter [Demequina sp. OYTSA14]WNM26325.1 ammonium transporter [Demequina sp. PMTSA13]